MTTLRARLLVGTTLAAGVILLAAGAGLYAIVRDRLLAQLDDVLVREARLLASAVEVEGGRADVELDLRTLAGRDGAVFIELWRDADGRALFRSASLHRQDLPRPDLAAGAPALAWVTLPDGRPGRAASLRFAPPGEDERAARPGDTVTLSLAHDVAALEATLGLLARALAGVTLAALAAVGLALSFVVRRALRPLGALAAELGALDAGALSRRVAPALGDDLPAELAPVVERLDGLLARLEAAFARERQLSADVAHELRTPLAALRTSIEVALLRPRTADEHAATLADALRLVEVLQGLIDKLLWLARLEGGEGATSAEPVDVGRLVEATWAPLAPLAAGRDARVALALEPGAVVVTDRRLLELILRNALENAATYVDAGGRVEVAVTRADGRVEARVTNSGSALAQDDVPRAFQRFWRGSTARTEAGVHCGLGLSLVERAARALGAGVDVRSTAGGDFDLRLSLPA